MSNVATMSSPNSSLQRFKSVLIKSAAIASPILHMKCSTDPHHSNHNNFCHAPPQDSLSLEGESRRVSGKGRRSSKNVLKRGNSRAPSSGRVSNARSKMSKKQKALFNLAMRAMQENQAPQKNQSLATTKREVHGGVLGGTGASGIAPAQSLGLHLGLHLGQTLRTSNIGRTVPLDQSISLRPGECLASIASVLASRGDSSMNVGYCDRDEECGSISIPLTTFEAVLAASGARVRGMPALGEQKAIACDQLSKSAIEDHQLELAETPVLPKEIQDLRARNILVKRLYLMNGQVYEETRRIVKSDPENPKTVEVLVVEGTLESKEAELLDNGFKFYDKEKIFVRPNQKDLAYVRIYANPEYGHKDIHATIEKFVEQDKPDVGRIGLPEWNFDRSRQFKEAMKSHSTFEGAYEVSFPFGVTNHKKVRQAFENNFPDPRGAKFTFTKNGEEYVVKSVINVGGRRRKLQTLLSLEEGDAFKQAMEEFGYKVYEHPRSATITVDCLDIPESLSELQLRYFMINVLTNPESPGSLGQNPCLTARIKNPE